MRRGMLTAMFLGLLVLVCSGTGQPPLSGQEAAGVIAGTVFDAATGTPIPGVRVRVAGLAKFEATTDEQGQYQLELPPGEYVLQLEAPGYLPAQVAGVLVKPNEVTDGTTLLSRAEAVTKVEVTGRLDEVSTVSKTLLERKQAGAVTDAISTDEISRLNASDAAEALARLAGVQVDDRGFVFVRGLGERYSTTRLNGSLVPSPDPERRVVALDLFPAGLVDQIRVVKSYTPDLPGEFSGGLVDIRTLQFPPQKFFRVSFSTGFNSRTTFRNFLSYPGGAWDAFGFDDGTRDLPAGIPRDKRLFRGSFSPEQLQEFGRAFTPNWDPKTVSSMRPAQSYNLAGGASFGKLGIVGAASFSNVSQSLDQVFKLYTNQGQGVATRWTDYEEFRTGSEYARLGGVLNVAYRLSVGHRLLWRNTFSHDGEKEARLFGGYNGGTDAVLRGQRLIWIERGVVSTQVGGEHLTGFRNSLLRWSLSLSRSNRDEPDTREVLWIERGTQFQFFSTAESGVRFYGYLDEKLSEPSLEWSLPFFRGGVAGQVQLGVMATLRDRQFQSRRFRYVPVVARNLDLTLPANQLLAPENISPLKIEVREITRATDSYTAAMDIYAGYAMADVSLGRRWRLVGGVRVEDALQQVRTLDPYNPLAVPVVSRLWNRDALPAVSLVYSLTPRQNLRWAYGRTLARPDFRELSPFDYTDVVGGWATVGNPDLKRTSIDNVDFRWEWFPANDQLVAVGGFYKKFANPIELSFEPGITLRRTYANAEGARNRGIEVEVRRRLGFMPEKAGSFLLMANFALIDSRIQIPSEQRATVTHLVRPLMGQSRYLLNATLDWTRPRWRSGARLLVKAVSRRLAGVGTFGLDDIYQEGDVLVDLVYDYTLSEKRGWTLRFSAENLTDNEFRWTQGGLVHRSFRLGRTYSIGLGFSLF